MVTASIWIVCLWLVLGFIGWLWFVVPEIRHWRFEIETFLMIFSVFPLSLCGPFILLSIYHELSWKYTKKGKAEYKQWQTDRENERQAEISAEDDLWRATYGQEGNPRPLFSQYSPKAMIEVRIKH